MRRGAWTGKQRRGSLQIGSLWQPKSSAAALYTAGQHAIVALLVMVKRNTQGDKRGG